MHDRQPTPGQEGRMLITPENGAQAFFAKVQMADNPLDEGTPLNTATLLKQQTAALFGLGATAVPDDVLAYLGQFNLHWWQRKNIQFRYITNVSAEAAVTLCTFVVNGTVLFADTIDFDETTGALSLHSPQTATVSYVGESDSGIAFLRGKYFKTGGKIYYASKTASYYCDRHSSPSPYGIYAGEVVVTPVDVSAVDYVHSSDRNAYPDSGTSGGYAWRYLGVPFENAVTAPAIETGSYVGTGGVGSSNPIVLNCEIRPFLVVIENENASVNSNAIAQNAYQLITISPSSSYSAVRVFGTNGNSVYNLGVYMRYADGTLSWYGTYAADYHLNKAGNTYKYTFLF